MRLMHGWSFWKLFVFTVMTTIKKQLLGVNNRKCQPSESVSTAAPSSIWVSVWSPVLRRVWCVHVVSASIQVPMERIAKWDVSTHVATLLRFRPPLSDSTGASPSTWSAMATLLLWRIMKTCGKRLGPASASSCTESFWNNTCSVVPKILNARKTTTVLKFESVVYFLYATDVNCNIWPSNTRGEL